MTWQPLVSVPLLGVFLVVGLGLVVYSAIGKHRTASWLAALRRGMMVALAALALAGPAIAVEQENVVSNVEIVFAVDRTGSMAAEDGPGGFPRLSLAKEDIRALVEGAGSARFAVVTWDSSSRVELPVTTDSSAVINFAETLHQEVSEFSTGSTLARPADTVRELLENSVEERPQNRRYLVVMTDGESTAGSQDATGSDSLDAWAEVSDLVDGGAVFGYGTAEGGPMRIYGAGGVGVTEEYMQAEDGQQAISKMDEEALATLADTLGVELLLNPSAEQSTALGEAFVSDATTSGDERKKAYTYSYVTWVPALALAALLAWEVWEFVAYASRERKTGAI